MSGFGKSSGVAAPGLSDYSGMSVIPHSGSVVDTAREDIESLRRRVISELVDLNNRMPSRRASRRERIMRKLHLRPRRGGLFGRFSR
jgi:hypothetical protein